ncbi:hypothetical protein PVW27_12650 [Seohaeicola sp. 4SK31]|nr:hypothetical protein [Seohaeicola sp. 4SK31]
MRSRTLPCRHWPRHALDAPRLHRPLTSNLRRTTLAELRDVIRAARPAVMDHLTRQG